MEKYNGCSVLQYSAYGRVGKSRKGVSWACSRQAYAIVLTIAVNSKFSFPI